MLVIVQWGVLIFPQSTQVIRSIYLDLIPLSAENRSGVKWSMFGLSRLVGDLITWPMSGSFSLRKKRKLLTAIWNSTQDLKKDGIFDERKKEPFCQVPFSQWCRQIWRLAWYVAMLEETTNSTPFCTLKKIGKQTNARLQNTFWKYL